ncbi:MAG: nucleotide-binding universal stress UspA family protein, partial [Gammaproteobacteria bacterium]
SRTSASIDVIHVLGRREGSENSSNLSGSIGLGARTALLEELVELDAQKAKLSHKMGRAILEDARNRITEAGHSDVNIKLRNGELVETVEELEQEADLIVIGKRGLAADFDKLHLGSNLERVVRSSHKPVLVASRAFKPISRVLIAFDGGESVMKAVEYIAQNSAFKGFSCQLLMVGNGSEADNTKLEKATNLLKDSNFDVVSDIKSGQAETVIAEASESQHYDLLVMGAYGHSRIRNLIIGSTTTEMIRSCKIPVLLFR